MKYMYTGVRRVSVKSDGLRAHQLMLNNRITVTLYTINLDDNVQNSVRIMNYEIMFISHKTHNVHTYGILLDVAQLDLY